jgi:hypothetical protein
MNEQQKKQIEYVVGIDLGHGETSAAFCPIQWDTPVERLDPVKDMEMGSNKKVLPSAIAILDNGEAYIGDAAFSPQILKKAKVHVCFKKKPENLEGESEKLMIRFMKEVYKRIRQSYPAMLTEGNHLVYIATPSGWDRKAQNLYVEMARRAGIPIGGVTKESRAAFVRAQNDVSSGVGRNADKGAIVFDMGSSTLDFTYMSTALPNLIDNGYDCGASFVEKSIMADKAAEDESVRLFAKKYPGLMDCLLFEARKVKENIYFDTSMPVKKTVNFDDIVDDEELEDERFKLRFLPGQLDELLVEKGYVAQIKEAMLDYRRRFIPSQPIMAVFMTGGASRMTFLKSLICECWGVEENQIWKDTDPSLTISGGVAEVARMDLRTQGADQGLEDAINELQNSDIIYDTFVQNYGDHLYDVVSQGVADCIVAFRDDSNDWTLYGLQQVISDHVKQIIADESKLTTNYMDEAIFICTAPVREIVENIIQNYASQGFKLEISEVDVAAPKVEDIDLGGVMQAISDKIDEQSASWGKVIGSVAIGGVVGFLFPVLGIIGGAYMLIKGALETEEEKKAKAMSKLLGYNDRQAVFRSLEQNWDSMCQNMRDSVSSALTSDRAIVHSINDAVRNLLLAYQENLKKARVLID